MGEQTTKAAAIVPPKKAGERLTLGELENLPKGTYLAVQEGRYAFILIWLANSHCVWNSDTSNSNGEYIMSQRFPPEGATASWHSRYRLATQAEIKKADKAHLRAWRKAYDKAAQDLAASHTRLMQAERECGLDIPPPPRELIK